MLSHVPRRLASKMAAASKRLFLGLDSSTQGLKATAVDEHLNIVHRFAINYQKELGEAYGLVNGVHMKPETATVTQPSLLYVDALDKLLAQMKDAGFPFASVAAVSGSGQQHGSVYLARGAREALRGLKQGATLKDQLKGAFSLEHSPIWMDSSTTAQCRALETAIGGPAAVAALTGSRAYERFTGNQIAKVAATNPAAYAATERIGLISSFMCSVLLGDYAPIDASDGCGMNLLDLKAREWSPAVLAALEAAGAARGLAEKLGPVVPSHASVGRISRYFAERYGFAADCHVIAWSGDNPCSVAGLGLRSPGDIAVSLGTSDTVFGITSTPTPGVEGHIFANPVDPASYMAMLCYKNGSLTRERVRDAVAGGKWETFGDLVTGSSHGNEGRVGFFIDAAEITPTIAKPGTRRFAAGPAAFKPGMTLAQAAATRVEAFTPPTADARAVLESQFLSMRVHGESVGLVKPKRVLATGGASSNPVITQVLADVFGAPVYTASQSDSASLGAALRAAHGYESATSGAFVPYEKILARAGGGASGSSPTAAATGGAGTAAAGGSSAPASAVSLKLASEPRVAATAVYDSMLESYKQLEAVVVSER